MFSLRQLNHYKMVLLCIWRKDFRTGGGGAKIDIKYAFKIKIGAETFCVFFTEPPHIH